MDSTHILARRQFIQAGFSSVLGLGAATVLAGRARAEGAKSSRAKSILIIFLNGGASHHETFDMKPEAPVEIRGQFKPASTSVPGIQICEHLPLLAKQMQRCAVVRSMAHREDNHLLATHQVLTGMAIPGGKFDQIASRNDWPCYGSALDYLRPRLDGVPNGVMLPSFLMQGPLVWPGQHAGMLGARHDPWHIKQDPNRPDFKVDSVRLEDGLERMIGRRALLEQLNSVAPAGTKLTDQQEQAFNILTSGKVAAAFELDREPSAVRDRYGRHLFGQSLLLARRLIEAGVPVVQANMGNVQHWDSHGNIFKIYTNSHLPPLDRGVSALLDDLNDRGLLDETMVVMFGEFGRTPKVNGQTGRDHWGRCNSIVFAGGGVKGGQVIGKTDKIGSDPITTPYSPMDLGATIYSQLGIDPGAELRDMLGRPVRLNNGRPIEALFA